MSWAQRLKREFTIDIEACTQRVDPREMEMSSPSSRGVENNWIDIDGKFSHIWHKSPKFNIRVGTVIAGEINLKAQQSWVVYHEIPASLPVFTPCFNSNSIFEASE